MDRTERQKLGIRRWIDFGGHNILQYCTGFGKTRVAIMLLQSMYKHNSNLKVLIVVPTDVLKDQWNRELAKNQLFSISKVEVINTAIKNIYEIDILILDEIHQFCSSQNIEIFGVVKYKYVLGLTATLERLDGRHELLTPYLTVCDTVTLEEALENNWVSNYRNYKVLLDVDLSQYWEYNSKFQQLFAYFNHDFKLVMDLIKFPSKAKIWAKINGKPDGVVRGYLAQFMRYLRLRKSFVMSHPRKLEIANKVLDSRTDKKCILFTATVKEAEMFKHRALVCHSQRKKNENKKVIEEFNSLDIGNIVSPTSLRTGVDIKGLSVGIALSCNSSQISSIQSLGRVVRFEHDKVAEFFSLVIKNSIEEQWFNNANKNQTYITISEEQLDTILNKESISVRPKKGIVDFNNRF